MKRQIHRQRHLRNLMSKYEIQGQRSGIVCFILGCLFLTSVAGINAADVDTIGYILFTLMILMSLVGTYIFSFTKLD